MVVTRPKGAILEPTMDPDRLDLLRRCICRWRWRAAAAVRARGGRRPRGRARQRAAGRAHAAGRHAREQVPAVRPAAGAVAGSPEGGLPLRHAVRKTTTIPIISCQLTGLTVHFKNKNKNRSSDMSATAVFRWGEKLREKVTSGTVAHCNTFRLFVINIILP